MGLNDYNSDMRKGGRGGGMNAYRPPASKEAAPGDGGSYYDKVAPRRRSTILRVSPPLWRLGLISSFLTVLYFLLWFSLVFSLSPPLPPPPLTLVCHWLWP